MAQRAVQDVERISQNTRRTIFNWQLRLLLPSAAVTFWVMYFGSSEAFATPGTNTVAAIISSSFHRGCFSLSSSPRRFPQIQCGPRVVILELLSREPWNHTFPSNGIAMPKLQPLFFFSFGRVRVLHFFSGSPAFLGPHLFCRQISAKTFIPEPASFPLLLFTLFLTILLQTIPLPFSFSRCRP